MKKKAEKHKPIIKTEKPVYSKKTVYLLAFIIFTIGLLIYANTLKNGYVLDDYSVIKENWVVKKGIDGISTIFSTPYRYGYLIKSDNLYRPLSLAMFAVEWQLSPDNPALSHFFNVFLYALTGLLLFFTLHMIFSKFNIIFPFVASLLYIAHPIHTEVVANIKSRDEILSFFFIVATLFFIWKYLKNNSLIPLIVSLFTFLLAFLSKESAITVLAIIPLAIYFFTEIPLKKIIITSALFLIPAAIFLMIRKAVIGTGGAAEIPSLVDNLLMAAPDGLHRFATAILILGKYLKILFLPHPLVSDYSFNQIPIVSFTDIFAVLALVVYLTMAVFAIVKLKSKNIFSFFILFFLITMSIYSNILVTIGSSFGERFLYMPSLAFCLGIAYVLMLVLKINLLSTEVLDIGKFKNNYKKVLLISVALVFVYSLKTYSRNKEWKNDYTLYSYDVEKSPNSAHMRYYYGLSTMTEKAIKTDNPDEKNRLLNVAIKELKIAVSIYPQYADAYDQIALAYFRLGDNQNALKYYQTSLKYNPSKALTYNNMGIIFFNSKDFQKALEVYSKAIELDSRFADAYMNLGSTYGTLGKFDKAIESFKKCLEYDPANNTACHYLGITYQNIGDSANAKIYMERAKMIGSAKK